jgi:uncharacterized protein (DUF58 family)
MRRLQRAAAAATASAGAARARWVDLASPVLAPAGRVLAAVSGLGWLVGSAGVASMVLSSWLGWQELRYAGFALLSLLLLAALLTIGRTTLEVGVRVEPQRVVAGGAAALEVRVTNVGRAPLLPVPLDVPAVRGTLRFGLPALAPGRSYEDVVVLGTERRGVWQVGPASTLRGDPFGLVRREVVWTEPIDFFVHPRTVYLDSLGTGLLKDLEGRSTNDVSMSDLAFHALREYAPGDDRRHIHWLSSAKRSGTTGSDEFMVRQFLDTRRSHLGILLDVAGESWLDDEEFETGVSVAASVAVRGLRDGMDVSQAAGPLVVTRPAPHAALDLFARAAPGDEPVEVSAGRLARTAPSVSTVLIVAGPLTRFLQLRRAKSLFGPDVKVVGVRVEHGASIGMQRSAGLSLITIGALSDLPRALKGSVAA